MITCLQLNQGDQMGLAQCPDCEAMVSTEAVSCPRCGCPRPAPIAASGRKSRRFGLGCLGILILGVVATLVSDSIHPDKPIASVEGTPPPLPSGSQARTGDAVRFEVLEVWPIRGGGYGAVLLIDPKHRNAADLRALGDELRAEAAGYRFAFYDVFDNRRAAAMRKEAFDDQLPPADLSLHDKHKIAFYQKNGSTGFHEYRFTLESVNSDKWTVIQY